MPKTQHLKSHHNGVLSPGSNPNHFTSFPLDTRPGIFLPSSHFDMMA